MEAMPQLRVSLPRCVERPAEVNCDTLCPQLRFLAIILPFISWGNYLEAQDHEKKKSFYVF